MFSQPGGGEVSGELQLHSRFSEPGRELGWSLVFSQPGGGEVSAELPMLFSRFKEPEIYAFFSEYS